MLVREMIHYVFYFVYNLMKRIYSNHEDHRLFSTILIYAFLALLVIPIISILTADPDVADMPGYIWILGSMMFIYIHAYYYDDERIKRIEKKFEDKQLAERYQRIFYWLVIIYCVLLIVAWGNNVFEET